MDATVEQDKGVLFEQINQIKIILIDELDALITNN
jgi:hypothetical protein